MYKDKSKLLISVYDQIINVKDDIISLTSSLNYADPFTQQYIRLQNQREAAYDKLRELEKSLSILKDE